MKPYRLRYSCGIDKARLPRSRGPRNDEGGFILPLAMILIIVLTVSGMSFLHLDFLERRVALNAGDNQSAFYLASAGLERGRGTFFFDVNPLTGDLSWTTVLNTNGQGNPNLYPSDVNGDPLLCPDFLALNNGCVIPPFQTQANNPVVQQNGDPVVSPDRPFVAGLWDDGSYNVRAFNNESGLVDTDAIITVRALANVRGEQKLLEIQMQAKLDLKAANTLLGRPADNDTNDFNGFLNGRTGPPVQTVGNPTVDFLPDNDPASFPQLPGLLNRNNNQVLDPDSSYTNWWPGRNPVRRQSNYYHDPSFFPFVMNPVTNVPNVINIPDNGNATPYVLDVCGGIQENTYYRIEDDLDLVNTCGNLTPRSNLVFVVGKTQAQGRTVEIHNNVYLDNTVIVSYAHVDFFGTSSLHAPSPYPAIVAGEGIHGNSSQAEIHGNLYALEDITGQFKEIRGIMIADDITLQGPTLYSDKTAQGQEVDKRLPGFGIPADFQKKVIPFGSWQEVE